jgi:hypothetical protein
VSEIRHQHVAAELCDQRFLAVLPAVRTQVTGEPRHANRRGALYWLLSATFAILHALTTSSMSYEQLQQA